MKSKPERTRRASSRPTRSRLLQAVRRCGREPTFISDIRSIYGRVDQAVAARAATCRACGRCCEFQRTGHSLFVSAGELALLLSRPPEAAARVGACPYQEGRLCTARDDRPLGCRTFFCADALTDWSRELYETHHRRIRRLHESHGVPYCYVELTAALTECV